MRWLVASLLSVLISNQSCSAADEVETYAKRYRAATTANARMLVCVDAINDGLIAQGKDIRVLAKIFFPDPDKAYFAPPLPGKASDWVVFFDIEKIKAESLPHSSATLTGWYFLCYYDDDKRIIQYYLTNTPFRTQIPEMSTLDYKFQKAENKSKPNSTDTALLTKR